MMAASSVPPARRLSLPGGGEDEEVTRTSPTRHYFNSSFCSLSQATNSIPAHVFPSSSVSVSVYVYASRPPTPIPFAFLCFCSPRLVSSRRRLGAPTPAPSSSGETDRQEGIIPSARRHDAAATSLSLSLSTTPPRQQAVAVQGSRFRPSSIRSFAAAAGGPGKPPANRDSRLSSPRARVAGSCSAGSINFPVELA